MAYNELESGLSGTAILELVLTLVVGVVAIVGNVLIVLAVYRNKKLRTPTNLLLLNLALADLLTGLSCPPLTASAIIGRRWLAGLALCQVQGFLMYLFGGVSIHTITVTAINRYFRILRPNVYRKWVTYRSTVIFLLVMWVFFACAILIALVSGITEILYRPTSSSCVIRFSPTLNGRIVLGLTIAFGFFYPAVTMALCYFKVFKRIRQHNSQTVAVLRRKSESRPIWKRRLSNPKPKQGGVRWPRCNLAQKLTGENTVTYNCGQKVQKGNDEMSAGTVCESTAHIIIENAPNQQSDQLITEAEVETSSAQKREILHFTPQTLHLETVCFTPTDKEGSRTGNPISESPVCQKAQVRDEKEGSTSRPKKKTVNKIDKLKVQRASSFGSNVEEIQITRILFVVLIGFVLCWVPTFLIGLLTYLPLARNVPDFVRFLSIWFVYLSSSLNVFIYGVMSKPFRREIFNYIYCRR